MKLLKNGHDSSGGSVKTLRILRMWLHHKMKQPDMCEEEREFVESIHSLLIQKEALELEVRELRRELDELGDLDPDMDEVDG